MFDMTIEIARALVMAAIFGVLVVGGRKLDLVRQGGWRLIVAGMALLLGGSLLDITDNFSSLNRYVVIGSTEVAAALKNLVGYLLGFLLLCLGLWSLLPLAGAVRREKLRSDGLERQLAARISRRVLLVIVVAVTGIFVVGTVSTLLIVDHDHREQLRSRAEYLAELQADALASPLRRGDLGQAKLIIETLARDPDFQFAMLQTAAGDRLAGYGTPAGEAAEVVRSTRPIVLYEEGNDASFGLFTLELSKRRLRESLSIFTVGSGAALAGILTFVLGSVALAMRTVKVEFKEANDRLRRESEDRKTLEESTQQAELQNRLILEAAADGIYGTDLEGKVTFANQAAARMVGYRLEDLIGREMHALIHHSYPDGTPYPIEDSPIFASMADGEAHEVENEVMWREDGTSFPVEYTSTPLRKEGEIVGAVITFKDITERLKIDRMKTEFISTVSHELRTPLTSIFGSLGLIRGGAVGELPTQAMAMIDIAYKNSDRLIRLINDILDIERIESGRMNFKLEPVDITELVKRAIETNKSYADQHDVALALVARLPDTRVMGDEDKLVQVLTNLLSNAAKFSPPHSQIRVAVKRRGPAVRVSVTDDGPGIPEEFRGAVFEKFTQADSSDKRQKGGSGLGLSICKSIIERHGGKIGFECGIDRGTTFYFYLPITHEQAQAKPATRGGQPKWGQHRILVCDRNRDDAMLLCMMLELNGLCSDVANDVEEARALLGKFDYAAMMLDLGPEDQDRSALVRELGSRETKRRLPIIVISADRGRAARQLRDSAHTIVDWLEKPIDKAAFESAVNRALSGSAGNKPRILHVEDDFGVGEGVAALFAGSAVVTTATSLKEANKLLMEERYDLIILDLMLPDGLGEDLLPQIRNSPNNTVPVIVYSAREVSPDTGLDVQSALVKSRATGEDLLAVIKTAIEAPEPVAENDSQHSSPKKVHSI